MYKITRTSTPQILIEKSNEWTEDLLEKRKTNPSYFIWHQYKYQPVNILLLESLLQMTKQHCAFCDGMFDASSKTIEHFRPKSKHPELAYQWDNLFPCCTKCQEKNDNFSDLLLKPDDSDYEFDKYFELDFINNKIIPKTLASKADKKRAETTIEIYKLNTLERCQSRKLILAAFGNQSIPLVIDECPYRYFLSYAS